MQIRGVEAVIFDLDGTLIDNSLAIEQVFDIIPEKICTILRDNNLQGDKKEIEAYFRSLHKKMYTEGVFDRDLWWNHLINKCSKNTSLSEKNIKNLTITYWGLWEEFSKPFADSYDLLEYLGNKYELALITDTDGLVGEKERRLDLYPMLKKYFKKIIISGEDTSKTKRDPQPFIFVAEKIHIKPEKCVYIGDSPISDIRGASKAGMRTILVFRGDWQNDIYPDYIVSKLHDITNLL